MVDAKLLVIDVGEEGVAAEAEGPVEEDGLPR